MDLVRFILFFLYTCSSVLLLLYGLNTYCMLYLFLRRRRANQAADADREAQFAQIAQDVPERLPIVTTQIPLYNEFNVAERVIRAVAAMDYHPRATKSKSWMTRMMKLAS